MVISEQVRFALWGALGLYMVYASHLALDVIARLGAIQLALAGCV
jgi:hypothetical protein